MSLQRIHPTAAGLRTRRRWRVVLAVIAVLLIGRELIPGLDLGCHVRQFRGEVVVDDQRMIGDDEDPPPAPYPVKNASTPMLAATKCSLECEPEGAVCRGLRAAMGCQPEAWLRLEDARVSHLHVSVHHDGGPFCFVPFLKLGNLEADLSIDIYPAKLGGDGYRMYFRGTARQRMLGASSCRQFRETLGATLAGEIRRTMEILQRDLNSLDD